VIVGRKSVYFGRGLYVCLFVWTQSVKFDIRVFIWIGEVTLDRISSIWTGV